MENKSLLSKLESINEQLNLAHYWIIFLKYKRILLFVPLLFGVLGFFIALNINPTFKSSASLVIEESTKNIVNIDEVYSDGGGGFRNLNYINNQLQILRSDEVLGTILVDKKDIAKAEKLFKKFPKNYVLKNKIFNWVKKNPTIKKKRV